MALSLLCGGLGVAEATVHVVESGVTYEVLTTQEVTKELDKKVSKEVADLTYAKASDVATNTKDIATNKGNIGELNGKLTNLTTVVDGKVDKADTLAGYSIKDAYTKGDVDDKLNKKADAANVYTKTDADANFATSDALTTAKTELDAKIDANTKKITDLQTTTNGQQTAIDGLNTKTTQISYDPAEGTTVNEVEFKAAEVDANGKRLTGVSTLHTTGDATVGGALNATGKVSGKGLDAGTEAITGGSLSVTGAVTGSSVNAGTLSTTGNATVGGNLKVTGTITTDKMIFGDKATLNYTEIDKGNITSKNAALAGDATLKSSSMELDHSKLEVAVADKDSNGHLTMTADQTSIKNSDLAGKNYSEIVADKDSVTTTVKDEKDNTTSTKSSATEIRNYAGDAAGNKTNNVQTATQNKSWAKDKDGNESSIVQTGKDITNTAQNGTITNDANHIENTANTMNTTVSGQATESYGKLDTTVNGAENHTVNGQQTNTVGDGQINNITGGQKNNILTGNQETKVSNGSIINKAENGDISNTAKNVTNVGTESVTNKVGNNEVKVSQDGVDIKAEDGKKITESVGTASRVVENDKITDKAADSTVTTEKGKGTTFGKEGSTGTTNIYGDSIKTGKINAEDTTTDKLTAGAAADADGGRLTVDAKDGVKGSYKSGDYTSRSYILANTLKSGVDNGKEPIDADFVGSRTDHYMVGDKAKLDETVKDADGSNVTKKTSTGTVTTITDGTGTTTTKTEQGTKDITNTAKDGTITNDAKDIVTNASNSITEKVGETNVTTKTTTSSKSEIQNADTITSVQQTENMVQSYVGKKDGSATNVTTNFANASANMVTQDGQTSTVLNNKDGLLVRNTANGSSFITADGTNTGAALEWTNVKGNEISTGKFEANYVKMDYADVMKDLGVHGNAKVAKNLEVGETTTTKTLKVTQNATVGGTLEVTGQATFNNDVDIKKNLSVGEAVTARSYNVGGNTYIDADGIHANNQKITDVADGSISEGSKDAVNGGQLYTVKNDLEGKVNKVGANAAAMANLHPMEFDPDSKWNIAAAIGNYGSETAAALGAFYRPNDDVMVNLSTAFGTGENMVGGGVSVRLGKGGNKLSREESNALKDQVNDLTARMDALLSVLNPNMSKDFPDVPENHWAYEAVSRLAGNDIVQGYPDGEFHGERTMTRYEMAEIIYNALSRGAEAEKELVEEFKPELQAMAASEKATAEKAEG